MKQWFLSFVHILKASVLDENERTKIQFLYTYEILTLVSALMTVVNIFTQKNVAAVMTAVFTVLCALDIYLVKGSKKMMNVSVWLFSAEIITLFMFFIVSGEPDGFSVNWVCLLPLFGMLLFNRKRAVCLCTAMFVMLSLLFWTPLGDVLLQFEYAESFRLRFPLLYAAIFGVSFFLASVQDITRDELLCSRKRYRYLCLHDALTGIYNRYAFSEKLANAKTAEQYRVFMILDIDHFKRINDSYGHAAGDIVLQKVAQTLEKCVGNNVLCRWGGEEFAIVFSDADNVEEKAQSICDTIRNSPILLEGDEVKVTVSIGAVVFDKGDAASKLDKILIKADSCMYEAKRNGRDRVVVRNFSEKLQLQ